MKDFYLKRVINNSDAYTNLLKIQNAGGGPRICMHAFKEAFFNLKYEKIESLRKGIVDEISHLRALIEPYSSDGIKFTHQSGEIIKPGTSKFRRPGSSREGCFYSNELKKDCLCYGDLFDLDFSLEGVRLNNHENREFSGSIEVNKNFFIRNQDGIDKIYDMRRDLIYFNQVTNRFYHNEKELFQDQYEDEQLLDISNRIYKFILSDGIWQDFIGKFLNHSESSDSKKLGDILKNLNLNTMKDVKELLAVCCLDLSLQLLSENGRRDYQNKESDNKTVKYQERRFAEEIIDSFVFNAPYKKDDDTDLETLRDEMKRKMKDDILNITTLKDLHAKVIEYSNKAKMDEERSGISDIPCLYLGHLKEELKKKFKNVENAENAKRSEDAGVKFSNSLSVKTNEMIMGSKTFEEMIQIIEKKIKLRNINKYRTFLNSLKFWQRDKEKRELNEYIKRKIKKLKEKIKNGYNRNSEEWKLFTYESAYKNKDEFGKAEREKILCEFKQRNAEIKSIFGKMVPSKGLSKSMQ